MLKYGKILLGGLMFKIGNVEIKNNVDYNKKVIVNCNDTLNVRDKRPIDNKLGSIVDKLPNGTEALLGYVSDNWGSIYYVKDNTSENGYFVKGWVWIFEIRYEIDTETNQYKFKLFVESADSSHSGVYSNYYKMK